MVRSMFIVALSGLFMIGGCQSLKDAAAALNAFKQLQFKLGAVNNFRLAGVDISRVQTPSNLTLSDGAKLLGAFNNREIPVSFRLNVEAKNPNTGGESTGGADLFFKRMEFRLYVDGKETIEGTVNQRIRVPATGATEIIPVDLSLDLMEFFGNRGYEDLLNLAFAIGGVNGSSSKLRLGARVTVETPLGDVEYPNELTIVNASFTN
jgi:hypothetical protein